MGVEFRLRMDPDEFVTEIVTSPSFQESYFRICRFWRRAQQAGQDRQPKPGVAHTSLSHFCGIDLRKPVGHDRFGGSHRLVQSHIGRIE